MPKILNLEIFLQNCKRIHGDKYDYSLVNYIHHLIKVKIICPIHGEFEQKPARHLSSKTGCRKCSNASINSNSLEFIKKSKIIHKDKYSYNKVNYVKSSMKVEIFCKTHNEYFYQVPSSHLSGNGCPKCAGRCYNFQDFLNKVNKVHNNKYIYKEFEYKTGKEKIEIFCKIHGIFYQRINSHCDGRGCSKCKHEVIRKIQSKKPNGWGIESWEKHAEMSKNFDGFKVYILRCWSEEEEFYKIGRTFKKIEERFNSKKVMPYNYEIVKMINGTAKEIFDLELKLKQECKNFKYLPKIKFAGIQECFINLKLEEL